MDRGIDPEPAALAPVPAYPRRAVEQYLADARAAWDGLQVSLREAEARHSAAKQALAAADESHRILGSMMVEAQLDLAVRRSHAEEAAATLLASADDEAARIVSAARKQAAAILGRAGRTDLDLAVVVGAGEAVSRGSDDQDQGPDEEPPWSPPPVRRSAPTVLDAAGGLSDAPDGADGAPPVHAVASAAVDQPSFDLWPSRRPAALAFDAIRWRPRWRRPHEADWPRIDAASDESFFSHLRDELRADGTLNAWFEPA